jgi:hypothetical protein
MRKEITRKRKEKTRNRNEESLWGAAGGTIHINVRLTPIVNAALCFARLGERKDPNAKCVIVICASNRYQMARIEDFGDGR